MQAHLAQQAQTASSWVLAWSPCTGCRAEDSGIYREIEEVTLHLPQERAQSKMETMKGNFTGFQPRGSFKKNTANWFQPLKPFLRLAVPPFFISHNLLLSGFSLIPGSLVHRALRSLAHHSADETPAHSRRRGQPAPLLPPSHGDLWEL